MAATVHHLHPPSPHLTGFLRVGHTGQKKLEALHAAGRFPYRRVVFDAAHLVEQIGLLERLTQRSRQLDNLSVVPDARRGEHFLLQQLEPAVRSAPLGARLKIANDDVRRLLDDARKRLVSLRDALDDLDSRGGVTTRSPAVAFRGGGGVVAAMLGR
jgi:hypothetical protein